MPVHQDCGCPGAGQCEVCDNPLDSAPFDNSAVLPGPEPGQEIVLARYSLRPRYCGILRYFMQFTDRYAADPTRIRTPGYQWQIRSGAYPLDPYLTFDHIINPWGSSAVPVDIRLAESVTIEFVVRNVGATGTDILSEVGGRIIGRHWYDTRFGGAPRLL
ncbi:hypothetical protein [Mycobacterium sp. ZZG]